MLKQDPAYKNIPLLKQTLSKKGFSVKELNFNGERFTQFTHQNGKSWITGNDKIYYPFVSTGAKILCKSKSYSNELAEMYGVNIPATEQINHDYANRLRVVELLLEKKSVIVKPLDSTLSFGLTTDIRDEHGLSSAIDHALTFSSSALVQEQVYGDDVRFIVLEGKVAAVLHRQTPRVVGDGVSTMRELIIRENQSRAKIQIPFDQEYKQLDSINIDEGYLTSDEVLPALETKELSREVLLRNGASIFNITTKIHDSYCAMAEGLAQNLGNGIIAIDVIIEDYRKKLTDDNYWFLEFNSSPALALPYCVRDGDHFDILTRLGSMIEESVAAS